RFSRDWSSDVCSSDLIISISLANSPIYNLPQSQSPHCDATYVPSIFPFKLTYSSSEIAPTSFNSCNFFKRVNSSSFTSEADDSISPKSTPSEEGSCFISPCHSLAYSLPFSNISLYISFNLLRSKSRNVPPVSKCFLNTSPIASV